jgi:hypothetical protein
LAILSFSLGNSSTRNEFFLLGLKTDVSWDFGIGFEGSHLDFICKGEELTSKHLFSSCSETVELQRVEIYAFEVVCVD